MRDLIPNPNKLATIRTEHCPDLFLAYRHPLPGNNGKLLRSLVATLDQFTGLRHKIYDEGLTENGQYYGNITSPVLHHPAIYIIFDSAE